MGATRIDADAVFDDVRARVDVGGQVFRAGAAAVGLEVTIRTAWGSGCATRSSALGSFGVWFSADRDAVGTEVAVGAGGLTSRVVVR